MKPLSHIKFKVIVIIFFFFYPGSALATINVVTTTQDIASIVKEVGGDLVNIKTIVRGYQDPHVIEAKPSFMLKVNRADLLVYQGLDLEVGWLPMLIQGGRNKKVMPGQLGHLDISQAISPLEVPVGQLDRSMGDVHPQGNPHYHLNPENGLLMADTISNRLARLDTANADAYKTNLEKFSKRLEEKIREWKTRMEIFQSLKVITYHATWNYLLDYFAIESIGTIENRPGIPPSGKHISELVSVMKQKNARVILQANFFEKEYSELLAGKTQGVVTVLPAYVGGVEDAGDYIALFDILINRLEKAFARNNSFLKKETP
jgi:zinc/manganese transport system substrate-binding protein